MISPKRPGAHHFGSKLGWIPSGIPSQILVLALGDPEDAERGIQQHALEVFEVEPAQALGGIHRAQRREVHVVEPALALARVDDAAHPVHCAEAPGHSAAHQLGRPAVDLHVFAALVVLAHAQRAAA